MKKTFVIGDIHGADLALQQILNRANVTTADTLIFLGDFVDGWSGSFQVIESLIKLGEQYTCIFVKGNHDAWCEEWLQTGIADKNWLFYGGQSTVESYADCPEATKQKHADFFNRCRNYYIDALNRLFIHAGFTSMHGPIKETFPSNYNWDRTLWEVARSMDQSMPIQSKLYPKRLKLFTEIYLGHTPTLHYDVTVPMHAANVWNMDTGAAFNGKLTIMDIDTKEYWQSDEAFKSYPGEIGRTSD